MAVSSHDTSGGKVGWTVGLASWLDDPASKVNRYWRAMEEGQNFTGLTLIGLWGNKAGTNMRPGDVRSGVLDAPGSGTGQKYVPFGETASAATALKRARFAFWYFVTKGKMGKPTVEDLKVLNKGKNNTERRRIFWWVMNATTEANQIPFVRAKAKRSVPARHYYAKAEAKFKPAQVEMQMLRAAVAPLIRGAFTPQKARNLVAMDSSRAARTSQAPKAVADVRSHLREIGLATFTATANVQDLLKVGGQFPAGQWQAMLYDINRNVAREFQDAVVAEMMGGIHLRPSTGDLIEATKNPRNRIPR